MLLTGGTGTPEPQTQTVESGKEATFTVNSKEPTRTNYDFKGWSTDKNATTASYHGGESIKISKDTTLYAVWANPNPSENPAPSESPVPERNPSLQLRLRRIYRGYPAMTITTTITVFPL